MARINRMTSRERINAALAHEEADRVALQDGPWATAITRWRNEGMPADVNAFDLFGFEMVSFGADTSAQLPSEVVEDTDEHRIVRNANGALAKNWKGKISTPEMIDFTIKTRDDWEQIRPRFDMNDSRVNVDGAANSHASSKKGHWVSYSGVVGYDKTQAMIGSENLLMAFAEDEEWVADMFMSSADLVVDTAQAMLDAGYHFDGAFLYDDMGYRNGTLFSPDQYRRLAKPAHAKAFGFFRDRGLPVILHSCGCVKEFIPDLIDAGLSCLQPLEVKAGMDVVELKDLYGDDLSFMGGIDVRVMASPDPADIEEEIRVKIGRAKQGGGYIYHSDHSVPDNVSYEQYCRVIDLVHEYGSYD